jgi:hypothetical protein
MGDSNPDTAPPDPDPPEPDQVPIQAYSSPYQADPFSVWLLDHPELVEFIQVDSADLIEDASANLISTLAGLTHIYNYNFLSLRPTPPRPSSVRRSDPQQSSFATHAHFFIQLEIFRLQTEKYNESLATYQELIRIIRSLLNSSQFVLQIDYDGLFRCFLSEPPAVAALAKKDSQAIEDFSLNDLNLLDFAANEAILLQLLYARRLQYDRNLFVPQCGLQEKFYQLLFHHKFVLKSSVDRLLTGAGFGAEAAALLDESLSTFAIADPTDVAVFTILFCRAAFDFAFENAPDMFLLPSASPLRSCQSGIPIEETGVDRHLLSFWQPEDAFADIIARDEDLAAAGADLAATAFQNSPLDVLYCVDVTLRRIRAFIARADPGSAQSFDTIFGLFLVVLIGCDVPCPEELFRLMEICPRAHTLVGTFDYARSIMAAAAIQCASIVENCKRISDYPRGLQLTCDIGCRYGSFSRRARSVEWQNRLIVCSTPWRSLFAGSLA